MESLYVRARWRSWCARRDGAVPRAPLPIFAVIRLYPDGPDQRGERRARPGGAYNEISKTFHSTLHIVSELVFRRIVLATIYFWWLNIKGMHESSGKALRIMQITTADGGHFHDLVPDHASCGCETTHAAAASARTRCRAGSRARSGLRFLSSPPSWIAFSAKLPIRSRKNLRVPETSCFCVYGGHRNGRDHRIRVHDHSHVFVRRTCHGGTGNPAPWFPRFRCCGGRADSAAAADTLI